MQRVNANDYRKLTVKYLQDYSYYTTAVKNMDLEIRERLTELQGESVKTSNYGPVVGGGTSELTATELAADKRLRLEQEVRELNSARCKLSNLISRIDTALDSLKEEDSRLIRMWYFDRYDSQYIADKECFSVRSCRRRVRAAEGRIAFMLFGPRADMDILFVNTAS